MDSQFQRDLGYAENYFEKDKITINNFVSENRHELFYKQMMNNICQNFEPRFYKKVCKDCKQDFEVKAGGDPPTYRYYCQNSYCKSNPCYVYRLMVYKELFTGFFNFYSAWRIKRNSKWVHFSIGAKRQSQPTRKELNQINRNVNSFVKEYNETFSTLRGLFVRDFSYDKSLVGEEWFIHFHFAVRPMKKEDFKEIQDLAEKHNLHYSYFGFRKSDWLIDYFSKRCAGKFEHECHETDWMFADLMDSRTYFETFHRSRNTWFTGMKEGEVKRLRKNLKQILRECEALTLSSKKYQQEIAKYCVHCGSDRFLKQEIKIEGNKPPPDSTEIEKPENKLDFPLEVIKMDSKTIMKKQFEKDFSKKMQDAITDISTKYKISTEKMCEIMVGKGSVADIKRQALEKGIPLNKKFLKEMGDKK